MCPQSGRIEIVAVGDTTILNSQFSIKFVYN